MITIDASKARKEFSATLKAARGGERIVLEKHGKRSVAIIPLEDLETLQRLEDLMDGRAADAAMREIEAGGGVAWDDVKGKWGL